MQALDKMRATSELPSREEARQQFDTLTTTLGIHHTFSFDEMYDLMLERRLEKARQEKFRAQITEFERRFKQLPEVTGKNPYPLVHAFVGGMYVRQITVPGNCMTVTAIHAQDHPFFILKGRVAIVTPEGIKHFCAPYSGITKAGTKRIIWTYTEVILTTVHRTDSLNIADIEDEVTAPNFETLDDRLEVEKIREFRKIAQSGV